MAVNDALANAPEQVNSELYDGGWLFKIQASDESEIDSLLDAHAYKASIDE